MKWEWTLGLFQGDWRWGAKRLSEGEKYLMNRRDRKKSAITDVSDTVISEWLLFVTQVVFAGLAPLACWLLHQQHTRTKYHAQSMSLQGEVVFPEQALKKHGVWLFTTVIQVVTVEEHSGLYRQMSLTLKSPRKNRGATNPYTEFLCCGFLCSWTLKQSFRMEHSGLHVNTDVRLSNRAVESSSLSSLILEVHLDRHFCRVPCFLITRPNDRGNFLSASGCH